MALRCLVTHVALFLLLIITETYTTPIRPGKNKYYHKGSPEIRYVRLKAADGDADVKKPKLTFSNLVQLVLMGAGAPGLGEYKGTDASGKMMFELEANNLSNDKGESLQTKAKYFNDGYVESDFEVQPPDFWSNLLSGGKLQREWDTQQEANKKSTKNKK